MGFLNDIYIYILVHFRNTTKVSYNVNLTFNKKGMYDLSATDISLSKCNTILSAYTNYRHLG